MTNTMISEGRTRPLIAVTDAAGYVGLNTCYALLKDWFRSETHTEIRLRSEGRLPGEGQQGRPTQERK